MNADASRCFSASNPERAGHYSRRQFIQTSALLVAGTAISGSETSQSSAEPIIDIHQHLGYSGRSDDVLLSHQRSMGISKTILLPAGRPMNSASTHQGSSNGLEAKCLGNEECYQFSRAHPESYAFGANEVPDAPDALKEVEKYLKLGAIIIAEQKFGVECDSSEMQTIYQLAADYRVPVLMHWQYQRYNYGFERFHKMLARHPRTTFIGHAQTWWAHIDKAYEDNAANLYPKGPVTPGGLTDRYLSDYPNMYADLSAGSGLNALTRDEDHARAFIERHQDKLIYGSDCNDGGTSSASPRSAASIKGQPQVVSTAGPGTECQGVQTIATLRRLAPDLKIQRKLFHQNARRLLRV
jgi:predicted TIM-barrel fold metal-dependent hydrolase